MLERFLYPDDCDANNDENTTKNSVFVFNQTVSVHIVFRYMYVFYLSIDGIFCKYLNPNRTILQRTWALSDTDLKLVLNLVCCPQNLNIK